LAKHGADENDEKIKKVCEFILENSQGYESDGFSIYRSAKTGGGRHSEVIPCLTGNMVWSLIKIGYLEDARVEHGITWITINQRFDDKINCPPIGWPYDRAVGQCFERYSCHMGFVKALKAVAAIPVDKRSEATKDTIERGAEYLLIHHIHKRSRNLNNVSKPSWLQFGFPLMYQTDVLEILVILTKLSYRTRG
jgi:hypothetical protein